MADEDSHYHGIVLYTDGGAKPNPGYTGWGVHGYHYTTEPATQGTGLSTHKLTTKGYRAPNTLDTLVQPLHYFDFFGSLLEMSTNNAAEIDALLHAIKRLLEVDFPFTQVVVYTDSDYLRRGIKDGVKVWSKNNWIKGDGLPVANADRWKELIALLATLKERKIEFDIHWVKGHSDNFGNTLADLLATIGVSYSTDGISLTEYKTSVAKGYWKSSVEKHPFITHRRLYFNSLAQYNHPGHYFMADSPGKELTIGKKTPDTSYSFVRLNTPETVIETVKTFQAQIANGINTILLMRLDKVYHSDVFPYIEQYGQYALVRNNRYKLDIDFLDSKPLTVEQVPPGLCLRAIHSSEVLEELLDTYLADQTNQPTAPSQWVHREYHDITSVFYETVSTKKQSMTVLKPEFIVGYRDITLPVTLHAGEAAYEVSLPLALGVDLLPRNELKRIESLHPIVTLMTWQESSHSFRYACIITIDAAVGIWCNFFSNQLFIPT